MLAISIRLISVKQTRYHPPFKAQFCTVVSLRISENICARGIYDRLLYA